MKKKWLISGIIIILLLIMILFLVMRWGEDVFAVNLGGAEEGITYSFECREACFQNCLERGKNVKEYQFDTTCICECEDL